MINMLMVQGTTSDAGKSTLVAGLCRLLKKTGVSVAPFKPQNMALNSAVTIDGGEIGRAQALQASACGIDAHTDMNPVLIKPSSDTGAQIIIQGQVRHTMNAQSYHEFKPIAKDAVLQSFKRLSEAYDIVLVEGAGSPAEINLREGDIANMGFAEAVDCPVILVADIDKGGVFAHIVGTLELLSESEKNRVKGFVINKFRGDIALLQPGLDWLQARTGKPVLGVLPYLHDFYMDAEDAIDRRQQSDAEGQKLKVVVPILPRVSNHTDFDVLRLHPQVDLHFVSIHQVPPACDLIILPGSKNVRADLGSLLNNGWQTTLEKHLRYGGKVIGICGGYQMLGQAVDDPLGVEGEPGCHRAFNFIPHTTILHQQKKLIRVHATLNLCGESVPVDAYEIHNGHSAQSDFPRSPIIYRDQLQDAYLSEDEQILGCYLHGLFDNPKACQCILQWAGLTHAKTMNIEAIREAQIERLASSLEEYLDTEKLAKLLQVKTSEIEISKIASENLLHREQGNTV
ncbi:cobyric acid synthase [Agarilytica rhodophyticola]|uniref:cobyric acid synthase n=1 Tax=Agarilytica rhodophyticola TaxID=1737490 RepID=UPI001C1F65C6|nr:cobyric acid synthase [Agarilytica rhodophyticola]